MQPLAGRAPRRIIIMGAAGRDFHDFNLVFRDDAGCRVVAFTAAQIPEIAGRRYPAALAGPGYPDGIPIYPETELPRLVRELHVDAVHFAYSDVPHVEVMHRASIVLAAGAGFGLLGPDATMLKAKRPVVSVCAVRTGTGKSPLSRFVVRRLREQGYRVAAMRHPMPYGDLDKQAVQRFASYADLDAARVTIEEREEYEPYLDMGAAIFAGVDYRAILELAERDADVVVWDGGNNDLPFVRPDLHIVLLDPHRPGHELTYHPGEANVRMADVLVISKCNTAPLEGIRLVTASAQALRPSAPIVLGELEVTAEQPELLRGRQVVLVEDGPTLTHGGMSLGAGTIAAHRYEAGGIVDVRPYAVGSIAETFRAFPHLTGEVPAMGYSPQQVADLQETLNRTPAELVVDATPVHLARLITLNKPLVNVRYEFRERGEQLVQILDNFAREHLGPPSTTGALAVG